MTFVGDNLKYKG